MGRYCGGDPGLDMAYCRRVQEEMGRETFDPDEDCEEEVDDEQ